MSIFLCGKNGHFTKVCHFCEGNKIEANMLIEDDMVTMLTRILLMNNEEYSWIYSGTKWHVTLFKSVFKTYEIFLLNEMYICCKWNLEKELKLDGSW